MHIEIWSDVVCPWCYIAKRRFERALENFPHRDEVELVWRSFELDPGAPQRRPGSYTEALGRKYGMDPERAAASLRRLSDLAAEEDLDLDFGGIQPGNTFSAHRLLHLAAQRGCQGALKERLLRGYFSEGAAVGDRAVLAGLAGDVGLDAAEVDRVLGGEEYADHVRADEVAAEELGVTGVPFFLFDRRFAVAGAQETSVFLSALERAWEKARSVEMIRAAALGSDTGGACDGGGSCAG